MGRETLLACLSALCLSMWLPGEVLAGQPSTIVDLAVISTADGTLRRIHGSVGGRLCRRAGGRRI